jgi:hypothetical protein
MSSPEDEGHPEEGVLQDDDHRGGELMAPGSARNMEWTVSRLTPKQIDPAEKVSFTMAPHYLSQVMPNSHHWISSVGLSLSSRNPSSLARIPPI